MSMAALPLLLLLSLFRPSSTFIAPGTWPGATGRLLCHGRPPSHQCQLGAAPPLTTRRRKCGAAVAGAHARGDMTAVLSDGEPIFAPLPNVQAGCVLVASPDEIDHFMRHAVCLVLTHDARGSRGVLLEMATAFTVGEMAAPLAASPFSDLPLFRGGSGGNDQILMVHDVPGLDRSQPAGPYGIHVGGLQSARDAVSQGLVQPDRFKFFFNQCEWLPGALEREVAQGIWSAVGVIPAELVLRQVGSQSERPLAVERKLASAIVADTSKPLWDILQDHLVLGASLTTAAVQVPTTGRECGEAQAGVEVEADAMGGSRDDARTYLTALARRELQALAKQHGIKANIKSADIIERLRLQGFSPTESQLVAAESDSSLLATERDERGGDDGDGAGEVGSGGEGGSRGGPAVGQRALFLQMMAERMWSFRHASDVAGLLPLLDVGAEVYGQKGVAMIEAALKAAWQDAGGARVLPHTLRIFDSGCGTHRPCPLPSSSSPLSDPSPHRTARQVGASRVPQRG